MSQLAALYADRALVAELEERFPGQLPAGGYEVLGSRHPTAAGRASAEAIVLAFGRPSLLIRHGSYEEPESDVWQERLAGARRRLEEIIPSVGRLELFHHPDFEWAGTAWVIDERTVVTNRHVAELFAERQAERFGFRLSPSGETIGAAVDFVEEHGVDHDQVVSIDEVLFMDSSRHAPDVAFLRTGGSLPAPLELADRDPQRQQVIGVVGYPAWDGRRNGLREMQRIFGDVFNVKRLAPGLIERVGEIGLTHDASTLGGNSGSPIVDVETGKVVGLHFAGRFLEANHGLPARVVKELLRRLGPPAVAFPGNGKKATAGDAASPAVATPIDELRPLSFYEDRDGYREDFLGDGELRVPLPRLNALQRGKAARVDGRRHECAYVLDYTHFSSVMNGERQLPYFTAVNIDGASLMLLRRRRNNWQIDPRIARDEQAGNELYRHNRLDRGHLVRRLDPAWGSSAQAKQAENDTFHYTNAAPQHALLNQRDWVALEDHLLDRAAEHGLRVSVFTGPVFSEADREYRGVQIPESFWKVVAMRTAGGELHTTAYVLGQGAFLTDIEFAFGEFQTFQTSVRQIETLTGLDFGELRHTDPRDGVEGARLFERLVDPARALGI